MDLKPIKEKRRSRSIVLLDYDDFSILNLCLIGQGENISYLKKFLNFTQKAIGIHIKRLEKYGLVTKERGQDKAFREKLISTTKEGRTIFDIYKKAIANSEDLKKELPSYKKQRDNKP